MDIRIAIEDDGPAVGALTEAAYRFDGYVDDSSSYRGLLLDGARRIREATVLLGESAGIPVATVTVTGPGEPWTEVCREGELEVRMLAVSPAHRRRGLAAELMAAVERLARDRGLDRVVLCTGTTMHGAQRLYEHLGFGRLPERDWSPLPGFELLTYGRCVNSLAPEGASRRG